MLLPFKNFIPQNSFPFASFKVASVRRSQENCQGSETGQTSQQLVGQQNKKPLHNHFKISPASEVRGQSSWVGGEVFCQRWPVWLKKNWQFFLYLPKRDQYCFLCCRKISGSWLARTRNSYNISVIKISEVRGHRSWVERWSLLSVLANKTGIRASCNHFE